ncbi:MAG: hypothetical protein IJY04_05470 [Clostridia bacterium]|nr:hypothetical protein [Clostridia bacterium]
MISQEPLRFLFIGNSATYVHEIPQTLARLAGEVGHNIETAQITPGGYELAMHADLSTEHGKMVFKEIAKGYDAVFLQDNGNCISSEAKSGACAVASARLINAIRQSGAKPYFYVRPPYGKDCAGFPSLEQCKKFDLLFSKIAEQNGDISCVYANRAFAHAIKTLDYNLWGDDNAHTSKHGAFLIVCAFFATLFRSSSTCLSPENIDSADALALAQAADEAVFDKLIP